MRDPDNEDRLLDATSHDDLSRLLEISYTADGVDRSDAIEELSQLATPMVRSRLIEALGDPEVLVKVSALEGLGRQGGETDIALIARFLDDEDPLIAEAAEYALGEIGSPLAIPVLTRHLLPLSGTERVQVEASLYKLGEKHRIKFIVGQLAEPDEWARSRALNALIVIADETNAGQILTAVRNIPMENETAINLKYLDELAEACNALLR
jgi:HEAT repeat protein